MLDIDEMTSQEIHQMLGLFGYGHLGYIHEGNPYVMPMHYYTEASEIYLFITVGMKTHNIDANPEVCLQVEEIRDPLHWRSVMINGRAQKLTALPEIEQITAVVKQHNPTLSPAINRTWIDAQGRPEVIAIYCLHPREISGRTTDGISSRWSTTDRVASRPENRSSSAASALASSPKPLVSLIIRGRLEEKNGMTLRKGFKIIGIKASKSSEPSPP
jgi:uncharacterized protein